MNNEQNNAAVEQSPAWVKTWPDRIWLVNGDGGDYPGASEEMCWSESPVELHDVEYIRNDLAFITTAQQQEFTDYTMNRINDILPKLGLSSMGKEELAANLEVAVLSVIRGANDLLAAINNPAAQALSALHSAPVQPIAQGEREAFEREFSHLDLTKRLGDYVHVHAMSLWEGWQARAAVSQDSDAQDAARLTQQQKIVLTGFTGVMCVEKFGEFQADVEKRLGRPVWTHEFAGESGAAMTRELYRDDFMAMIGDDSLQGKG